MRLLLKLGAVLLAGALCGGPVEAAMLLSAGTGGAPGVGSPPPALTMTGSGMSTSSLACSQGTWTGNPTITYAYQFNRDGTAIAGATTSPYTAVTADQGHTITCTVTATNGVGSTPYTTGPQAVASCSQSASWFSRVWAVPTTVNQTHVAAYDTMICGLVSDNVSGTTVWSSFDVLYILATQSEAVARLNLISSSFPLTKNGTPTFTPDAGYTGTEGSATIYLDTGYIPSSSSTAGAATGSAQVMVHILTAPPTSGGASANLPIGASDGTYLTGIMPKNTNGSMYFGVNNPAASLSAMNTSPGAAGEYLSTVYSSSAGTLWYNGTQQTISNYVAATGLPTKSIYILNFNPQSGSPSGNGSQVAAAFLGRAPPSASNIYNRICTYIQAVHGGTC